VRNVILRGEEAIRTNRAMRLENSRLSSQNAALGSDNTRLAEENRQALERQRDLERRLRATDERLAQRSRALKSVEADLAGTRAELASAQRQVADARARNARLVAQNRRIVQSNARLTRRNATLAEINTRLAEEFKLQAERNRALQTANAELAKTKATLEEEVDARRKQNEEYARVNDEIAKQNTELVRQREKLSEIYQNLYASNEDLQRRNRELTDENRRLEEATRGASIDIAKVASQFEAMRTRRVVIHGGEDLARKVVPARSSPDAVRRVLEDLIHEANLAALAKGAGPGEDGALAVQVVDKKFYLPNRYVSVVPVNVTQEDRKRAVISQVAFSDMPVCLLAIAVANSVEAEPAAIDFQPLPNGLIYPRGRTVSQRRVDASQSRDRVLVELMDFLKSLGQAAMQRGMIPRIDPATGEPRVGSLDWPELMDLVERVKAHPRFVKVTAVAQGDIEAADPLRLQFRIDPSL